MSVEIRPNSQLVTWTLGGVDLQEAKPYDLDDTVIWDDGKQREVCIYDPDVTRPPARVMITPFALNECCKYRRIDESRENKARLLKTNEKVTVRNVEFIAH